MIVQDREFGHRMRRGTSNRRAKSVILAERVSAEGLTDLGEHDVRTVPQVVPGDAEEPCSRRQPGPACHPAMAASRSNRCSGVRGTAGLGASGELVGG